MQPFAFLAIYIYIYIEFNFYQMFLKLLSTKYCIWQRMGRSRFVSGAFPESGKIGIHGPGKFEQDPLAEVFGKNHPSNNAQ